jgi:SAM-dependent methyltransferase
MLMKVRESRFWATLWSLYSIAPSIVICRVPELETASLVNMSGRSLDHCCGDGRFAALAWPGRKLTAGCDIDLPSAESARTRGIYERVDVCDASVRLPYDDATFDVVFNNSGLEHISRLDEALNEIGRVLAPGGTFAFNVLNHRYFEWWPLGESEKQGYREWQPFFHALSLSEWERRLAQTGMKVVSVEGYFNREASRYLSLLDYSFSGVYMKGLSNRLVDRYRSFPRFYRFLWRQRLGRLQWQTGPDEGSGYAIHATRI